MRESREQEKRVIPHFIYITGRNGDVRAGGPPMLFPGVLWNSIALALAGNHCWLWYHATESSWAIPAYTFPSSRTSFPFGSLPYMYLSYISLRSSCLVPSALPSTSPPGQNIAGEQTFGQEGVCPDRYANVRIW